MIAHAAALLAAVLLIVGGCASRKPVSLRPDTRPNTRPVSATAKPDSAKSKPSTAMRPAMDTAGPDLSKAAELMIRACDNYISVTPGNPKIPAVLDIKASVYYNNRKYPQSRSVYRTIIEQHPQSAEVMGATRMIAQSYYEEKNFDSAQAWYRSVSDLAGDGQDRQEALSRIAESIFKMAEMHEAGQRYKEAAASYERVALEFPESKIADVALYNAGLSYDKTAEWSHAILVLQRLVQKYPESKLLPKARFRTAKCYEKLLQWDNAAEMYLRVVANHPQSDQASSALYNAGFCFENGDKLVEAATAFEKLAQLYPKSEDAPDVLFKAGELYGKVRDWAGVTRVNQEFSRRFGNDAERTIQALCMVGIALYMQDKREEAVVQLQKTIAAAQRLKSPSPVNSNYAAKAQYTLGEIAHEDMKKIVLVNGKGAYRKSLELKRDRLESAIKSYSQAVRYGIVEWTTRGIFQMGQAYEDFAVGVMRQQRSDDVSFEEQFALELGIAKAVEEYFVQNALPFHERNTKLGIEEKIDDKYVAMSRKKLTYLPYLSGENYLTLVTIFEKTRVAKKLDGFALIAEKLEVLQKIAPFQERAIELFKIGLEMGSRYREIDDFYKKSSAQITKTAFSVGQTYADVASVARDAPVPPGFDGYETFVYKTKLLGQIGGYEDQAYENFLKTLKIAEAYGIEDAYVEEARRSIPRVLFIRGRCYDLLSIQALANPPFPANIDESEKAEYRARFEEVGLKLQDQAFEAYRTVLELSEKKYASGDYVTHAYVRLFQAFPQKYGVKTGQTALRTVTTGPQWKCTTDSVAGWYLPDAADTAWSSVRKAPGPVKRLSIKGFPDTIPTGMWLPGSGHDSVPARRAFFRRTFSTQEEILSATLHVAGVRACAVFLNGSRVHRDSTPVPDIMTSRRWDVGNHLRRGKNVLALLAEEVDSCGLFVHLATSVTAAAYLPKPPNSAEPMDPDAVAEGRYLFAHIKNFSPDESTAELGK